MLQQYNQQADMIIIYTKQQAKLFEIGKRKSHRGLVVIWLASWRAGWLAGSGSLEPNQSKSKRDTTA